MGNYVILTTLLVLLIVFDASNASKSAAAASSVSPILSPIPPEKQSRAVGGKKDKEKQRSPLSKVEEDGSKDKKVEKNTNMTVVTPPTDVKEQNDTHKDGVKVKEKVKQKEEERAEGKDEVEEEQKEKEEEKAEGKDEVKEEQKEKEKEKAEEKEGQKGKEKEKVKEEKGESKTVPIGSNESCDGLGSRCQDLKSMTACIKSFDHGFKALVLLIQNKGDSSMKVDLPMLSSGSQPKVINIPKHQSKQVNMTLADGRISEITLNAGNGHCVLHLGAPVSQGNFFRRIPSYSKFVTPVYGAYLILLITFIAGRVWVCCWLRKRKGQREIPYQELEMSMPESAAAAETAEGWDNWDEVWDDDWDAEKALRSPGGLSISANGLTSRNPKKDDWEDWDD